MVPRNLAYGEVYPLVTGLMAHVGLWGRHTLHTCMDVGTGQVWDQTAQTVAQETGWAAWGMGKRGDQERARGSRLLQGKGHPGWGRAETLC